VLSLDGAIPDSDLESVDDTVESNSVFPFEFSATEVPVLATSSKVPVVVPSTLGDTDTATAGSEVQMLITSGPERLGTEHVLSRERGEGKEGVQVEEGGLLGLDEPKSRNSPEEQEIPEEASNWDRCVAIGGEESMQGFDNEARAAMKSNVLLVHLLIKGKVTL
jgi:hypothetical protein